MYMNEEFNPYTQQPQPVDFQAPVQVPPQQSERGKSPALCIISMAVGIFSILISAPMAALLTSILYNIKHGHSVYDLLLSRSTEDIVMGTIEMSLIIIVAVMLFIGLAAALIGLVFGISSVKEKRRKIKMAYAGISTSSVTLVAIIAAAVYTIIYLVV